MITSAIKIKVDKIWTDIAAGGITNPIAVIEQLTYLLFIRSLDEKELENEQFENISGIPMEKIFTADADRSIYALEPFQGQASAGDF